MDPESLRRQLAALHDELRQTRQVDPGSGALLTEILHDIQRLLDERDAAAAAAAANSPLSQRLERAAVQFEADHPGLASSSRRLIDLLGKAGF